MAQGIPRPGGWTRRFFTDTTPYDLLIAVIAALASALSAVKFFDENKPELGVTFVAIAIAVCVVTIAKVLVTYITKEAKQSPHLLESSLHALYVVLLYAQEEDTPKEQGLRITVHVPINRGTTLQQVLDYVGDQRDNKRRAGRMFPGTSGIIGKALQEKEVFVTKRQNTDYTQYIKELITEWGYTKDQAEGLHPGTMAWMAIPLFDQRSEGVEGVVYLDSTDPDFFTDIRKMLAMATCVGIAKYVNRG